MEVAYSALHGAHVVSPVVLGVAGSNFPEWSLARGWSHPGGSIDSPYPLLHRGIWNVKVFDVGDPVHRGANGIDSLPEA